MAILSGREILIVKAADETIFSDDTLTNDATLLITVADGESYGFEFNVFFTTPAAADFKYRIHTAASPTYFSYIRQHVPMLGTGVTTSIEEASADVSVTGANTGTGHVLVRGLIYNSTGSSITLSFQWAQNTSNVGSTVVKKGSTLKRIAI